MPDTENHDDLPSHAHERLAQMRGQGDKRTLFTSDLSVNEFLLVKEVEWLVLLDSLVNYL